MKKFNCLIIDDEPIAQKIIEGYIKPLDQLEVIGKCKNALEANNLLHQQPVDLLFLDIEMPHLNGMAFLKNIKDPPMVIITTAYRDYALESFELEVVDYLLKPISQERFLKAINRILSRSEINPGHKLNYEPYIYLKVDAKMVKIVLADILYIEGLSNYVRIFSKDKTFISYQKLSYLEEVLPSDQFIRSHRSYIVNIHKITSYTTNDIDIGKVGLPIGGSYKKKIITALSRYEG